LHVTETTNVVSEVNGPVVTIRLNRPAVRNCVDGPTALQLRAAFERFEADPGLKVAILAGEGGTFCAGADLTAVGDPARRNELDPTGGGKGPMGPSRMALSKPLIAAVSGYAVAGGLELALLADLRIVEEDAVMGVFCRRWGVPLIDGGTVRLPRIVGLGRALDLILTGRPVDAAEALSMGLANRVVPKGEAIRAARELAVHLLDFPFECLLTDRASVYAGLDLPMAEALRQEGAAGVPIVDLEGVAGAARFAAGQGRHGSFTTPGGSPA
jgi:enoyl-CoA hydratase